MAPTRTNTKDCGCKEIRADLVKHAKAGNVTKVASTAVRGLTHMAFNATGAFDKRSR